MNNNDKEAVNQLLAAMQGVYDLADKLPAQFGSIKILVKNAERQNMNRITGTIGGAILTHGKQPSQPITHIMGVPVKRPEPVTPEKLKPTEDEVKTFAVVRDTLYDNFPAANADVLGKYEDAVIRAVAKKAGVPNYKKEAINDAFIDAIRAGITK